MTNLLRTATLILTGLCALDLSAQTEDYEAAANAYRTGHYLESYYIWKRLAADGDPASAFNLGVLYALGQGVSRDPQKAVELYLESAKGDYAPAQFNLGMAYLLGEGVAQDFEKAARWWTRAAELEHVQAVFNLARMFETGLGVRKNPKLARKLYRRAADFGDQRAAQMLADTTGTHPEPAHKGSEPRSEEETPTDPVEAGGEGTAETGLDAAGGQEVVETGPDEGSGIEGGKAELDEAGSKEVADTGPDEPRGEDWIMAQPDQNYAIQIFADSSESTARSYVENHRLRDGAVIFRVTRDGATWYKALYGSFETRGEAKAARDEIRQYSSDESAWLRKFIDVKNEIERKPVFEDPQAVTDRTHALDSFAEGNDVGAVLRRGQYAFNRQQYHEAFEAWMPLAVMDVAEAQYGIGFLYESGWGVDKDHAQAFQWYERAARLGHAKSQYNLGRLYLSGRGVKKSEQQGLDWINRAAARNDRRAVEFLSNAAAEQR